eukprot:1181002-Prorocentrum_minimum.AAC.1
MFAGRVRLVGEGGTEAKFYAAHLILRPAEGAPVIEEHLFPMARNYERWHLGGGALGAARGAGRGVERLSKAHMRGVTHSCGEWLGGSLLPQREGGGLGATRRPQASGRCSYECDTQCNVS